MAAMKPAVRQMTRDELDVAIGWAEAEGWGPGHGDADAFFAADPGGFWALDLGGEMVACISAVRHRGGVVFMGFYIVEPGNRALGLGKHLWDEVWSKLDGLVLAGDAVPQQLANYEKDGFVIAHRNARYLSDGQLATGPSSPAMVDGDLDLHPGADGSMEIVDAPDVEFERLVDYDGRHCFGERPEFLESWIAPANRRALVAVGSSGEIVGFGAIRPATDSDRIGPLCAEDPAFARALLLGLVKGRERPVAIDVPLPNLAAVDLVESLGMKPGFETARIYRGEDPKLPLERIFGITSLELG
jgi:hypothetical protein